MSGQNRGFHFPVRRTSGNHQGPTLSHAPLLSPQAKSEPLISAMPQFIDMMCSHQERRNEAEEEEEEEEDEAGSGIPPVPIGLSGCDCPKCRILEREAPP